MDPESFVRGLPTLTMLFLGREDPNTTKSGSSSVSQQNAILKAFPLRANDGPALHAGLAAL